ncbi:MAG: substrate-binding domain-containing protein [Spirochaetales bacterium]|nr:substrate-binding domain-containing protein [Spirochaetales bacterium]
MRQKIGFIMASIQQGSSSRMWQELIKLNPKAIEATFFVFPGGRLSHKAEGEYLRNSIYNFVSSDNLDGAVCWLSSLTGSCSNSELDSIVEQFAKIPLVSIGQSLPNIPSVWFDAYGGMASEVRHFINIHKAKRIAFIRGPVNHQSSQERFNAYVDCLKEANIGYDKRLVSSPFSWSDGDKAIKELLDERGLIPGKDFEVLICASDFMLSKAVEVLTRREVKIPEQLKVAGFNDNDGIYMMSASPTTVKMPIASMVSVSFQLIKELLESPTESITNINLPSTLVIRRSCGCKDSFGGEKNAKRLLYDKASFLAWFINQHGLKENTKEVEEFFNYLFEVEKGRKEFFPEILTEKIETFLWDLFELEVHVDFLVEAFKWLNLFLITQEDLKKFIQSSLLSTIAIVNSRYLGRVEFENLQRQILLTGFKNELLQVRSFKDLSQILNTNLKKLSYREAYLVLYKQDYNLLVEGYDNNNSYSGLQFESNLIVPPSIEEILSTGLYVVEPLFVDQEELGHLVLAVLSHQAVEIEDIAASLSSAIKGIRLLEEANLAKEKAEKAERASSEFFTNISEGLKEPISILRSLANKVSFTSKKLFEDQLIKAEQLLELSLSQQGELELERLLVSPNAIFENYKDKEWIKKSIPDELPAIFVDSSRLKQGLDIYLDSILSLGFEAELKAEVSPQGLKLSLSATGFWSPSLLARTTSFLLAEKMIILHSGSVEYLASQLVITLLWPSLSEKPTKPLKEGQILYIKNTEEEVVPSCLGNCPTILDDELIANFSIPSNVNAVALSLEREDNNRDVVMHLLSNSKQTQELAYLCFSLSGSYSSLSSAFNLTRLESGNVICVLGDFPHSLLPLTTFSKVLCFSNLEALKESHYSQAAGLIIFQSVNLALLGAVRKDTRLAQVPVLILADSFKEEEVEELSNLPNLLICNTDVSEAEEFISRIISVICKEAILPPLTGALVKKAIAYLNKNARCQISRWQIAGSVNISEDYLTRIFHKEIGLSPTDYLNRLRIQLACEELKLTGSTINEVAFNTGFQDQAYFCRVFKKIKGFSPGNIRKR